MGNPFLNYFVPFLLFFVVVGSIRVTISLTRSDDLRAVEASHSIMAASVLYEAT
jgi:hypothetical protein